MSGLAEQVIGDAAGHRQMQQLATIQREAPPPNSTGRSTTSVKGPAEPTAVTAPSTVRVSRSYTALMMLGQHCRRQGGELLDARRRAVEAAASASSTLSRSCLAPIETDVMSVDVRVGAGPSLSWIPNRPWMRFIHCGAASWRRRRGA